MNFDIDKIGEGASKMKLPGGVVGKVCVVLVVVCLTVGSLGALSHSDYLIGGAIVAIIGISFTMLWRLINFANKNPQAALLEGAEFVAYKQIEHGTKGHPVLPLTAAVSESSPEPQVVVSAEEAALPDPDPKHPNQPVLQEKTTGNG